MADDAASEEPKSAPEPALEERPRELTEAAPSLEELEGPPEHPAPPREEPPRWSWLAQHRTLAMALGCAVLCVIIGVDIFFMLKSDARRGLAPSPSASSAVATPPAMAEPLPAPSSAPLEPGEPFEDATDDGEPRASEPAPPKRYATVQAAAAESCTTASVDGLSRQIIAQGRCFKPNAFVPLPPRPNLVIASQVFPYLEKEAHTKLLKALDSRPNTKMTINSALRTVAQQYLVWRWSANKRCGVPLATRPGESNHEIGLAIDIAEAASWRPTLEAQNFRWLGASDRVHFDYKGGAAKATATDVLAFQMLWNKNHPEDKISQDGRYTPATEERLKRSPPDGFRVGPSCGKPSATKPVR
jgi:D-alanyl-D-alanine carboxypeptidase